MRKDLPPPPKEIHFGDTLVPIRDAHSEIDAAFVPTDDEDYEIDNDLFEKISICVDLDLPLLISGPKGCGKTSAIAALASYALQPLRRINLNQNTRARDFVGYRTSGWKLDEKSGELKPGIVWVDGVLPSAMRENHWLIIDEIDAAPPGVLLALQSVLEPDRTLFLPENDGEALSPKGRNPSARKKDGTRFPTSQYRNFRIFATANTLGYGDDSGIYAGTNVMNGALLDRFVVIKMDYPSIEKESKILTSKTGLNVDVANRVATFAARLRGGNDADVIPPSTRQLIYFSKILMSILPEFVSKRARGVVVDRAKIAYDLAIGDKLPEEDRKTYLGVFEREVFKIS